MTKLYTPLLLEEEYEKFQEEWPDAFPLSHSQWSEHQAERLNRLRKRGVNAIPLHVAFDDFKRDDDFSHF